MTVIRRVLVAGGVAAGLAGAYFAGATSHRPPAEPETATAPPPPVSAPAAVTEVNGMKVPDALPPAAPDHTAGAVKEPTGVLTGAIPVPPDVLRAPPPAKPPEFVIPDLSAGKK